MMDDEGHLASSTRVDVVMKQEQRIVMPHLHFHYLILNEWLFYLVSELIVCFVDRHL